MPKKWMKNRTEMTGNKMKGHWLKNKIKPAQSQ